MIKDASNRVIDIGDAVEIISLPDRLLDGLPKEEWAFLSSSVGRVAIVDEFAGGGSAVISLRDTSSGIIHFVHMSGSNLKLRNSFSGR